MKKYFAIIPLFIFLIVSCSNHFNPDYIPEEKPPVEIPLTYQEIGLESKYVTMSSIYVSWNKQEVVSDYSLSIYQIKDGKETFILSKTISSNSFLITNLNSSTEYLVKISFVLQGKTIAEYSQIVVKTSQIEISEWEVTNYQSDTETGAKISWSQWPANEVESIKIFKSSDNKNFTLIKKIQSDYSKTYFVDTDVESQESYWYKIAIDLVESTSKKIQISPSINLIEASEIQIQTGFTTATLFWPEDDLCCSYVIEQLDSILPESKILRKINSTTNSIKITGLQENSDSFFRVYGIDGNLHGPKSQVFIATTKKFIIGQLDVSSTQTQASIQVNVEIDQSENLSLSLIEVNSKKEIASSQTNSLLLENLYPGYHFGKDSLQLVGTLTYKYLDDADCSSVNSSFVQEFSTMGLNPPVNIELLKVGRKSIELSFEPIEENEKFGLNPVYAIRQKGHSQILARSSSSPIKIENLLPGKKYEFEFFTTFENEYQYAEHVSSHVEYSTIGDLSIPEFTISESNIASDKYRNNLTVSWNAINEALENPKLLPVYYQLNYKIFKASDWKHSTDNPFSGMENYSGTIKVNRGNFYRVAVSAFIEDDKDCAFYKEKIYQVESLSDPKIFASMIYTETNELGCPPGKVVDLTDSKLWGGKSIKWSDTEMSFGKLDLLSGFVSDEAVDPEDEVDLNKNFEHTSTSPRYTLILTLTDEIRNADNLLHLIIFDSRSVISESEISEVYSTFDCIEIFKPYADSIPSTRTPLTTFGKDGAYEQLNAPNFLQQADFSLVSDDKGKDLGFIVAEEYIYNNCIVISVRKETHEAGFYGFSYYY